MADARGHGRAPPLSCIHVTSATFLTSMVLILAASWVLTVLTRSVRPTRGRTLGSFCENFEGAATILGGAANLVRPLVIPATTFLGPDGPRVAVPRSLRDVVHAAAGATQSAATRAGAILIT